MKQGIIVTNITQTSPRFRKQVDSFLFATNRLKNFKLTEVKASNVIKYLEVNKDIDFCLFWDKDIYLARLIEEKGIKTYNSSRAIALCDDKGLTYQALKTYKVKTPNTFVFSLTYNENINQYLDEIMPSLVLLGFPLVIKERFGSFGEQVYLVNDVEELKQLLTKVGDSPLLAQTYIDYEKGVDYRVYVINGKAVLAVKRENKDDFRSNVNQGGVMSEVFLDKKMEEVATKAAKATQCVYAGVDLIKDEAGNYLVLEVNSNARTINAYEASGFDLAYHYLKFINEDNDFKEFARNIKYNIKDLFKRKG